jgi:hypothetical protein
MKLLIAAASLALVATAANSHHGSNGQFDHDNKIQVTGLVKQIRFVNPHSYVYFDVTSESGELQNWRCEMRAGSLLKKNGWTEEMFSEGTGVVINGSQARREEHGCYVDTIAFDNGQLVQRNETIEVVAATEIIAEVVLAPGTPNINGNWERAARVPGAPRGGGTPYMPTALNTAQTVGFDREMNPRFACQVTNIFHDWTFDEHINTITQTDDKIVLTYGFMDLVRTINLDMESHPKNIIPSSGGHSIGKWEGNTLVVDTVGFLPGWLEGSRVGIRHGANMQTVERHTLSVDGQSLTLSYTITDPEYLEEPYSGQATVSRTPAAFDPYACVDLTEELVEGF